MTIELKQNLILKSADGEYVYNIFSYHPDDDTMTVDILNQRLETLATRQWKVDDFKAQINAGTIVEFKKDDVIGE